MKIHHNAYLALAVIGTIVPWAFFASYFGQAGTDLLPFVKSLFANGAAGGFSADVLISCLIFWIWSFADAKEHNIKGWWLLIPASFLVGLSLAMPMYFFMRTKRRQHA